jgi:zinc-ribbon domain
MTRYCPNCGTEVDDTAAFCPTCGQPIDQAAEAEIPPAPAWPDPVRSAEPEEALDPTPDPVAADDPEPPAAAPSDGWVEEPTRVETSPPPAPAAAQPPPPAEANARRGPPTQPSLPITWPVTLSAWLIGGGVLLAAVGVIIGMFVQVNVIDLLLLLLFVAIAATVFFSASVPAIPHLRLATLVVVLIGVGIGIDRIGFGATGAGGLLLFLGVAAAAIGAILLEIGRDQPLGGPRS